ncbi:MAG: PAS domain S-box protein [Candidatus Heimdallarchaeaceae archaeon]
MVDKPDIVKKLIEEEKLGKLQVKEEQNGYEVLEKPDDDIDKSNDFTDDTLASVTKIEEQELANINLSDIIESISDGFFVLDNNLVVSYFNNASEKLLGRKREDVLGHQLFEAFPEAKGSIFEEKYTWAVKEHKFVSFETFFGVEPYVDWYDVSVYPNENGISVFFQVITKRKQTDEALQKTTREAQFLAELLNRSSQPFAVGTIDGRLTKTNPAFCELTGYSEEELLTNISWNETLTPPEWREYEGERLQEVLATGKPQIYQKEYIHKDGRRIPVELLIHRSIDAEGNIENLFGFITDITERKKAEEELESASEEWKSTFDSISDLVSVHDKDFRIIKVNKAFAKTFGKKPDELIGKHCYELVHGTKEPIPNCPHRKTLETNEPTSEEFFEPHLGIHLNATTSPLYDGKGVVCGSIHLVKDINERKQAEEKLKKSEERFRDISFSMADWIWEVDKDGRYIFASGKVKEILGYESSELLGKTPFDFMSEDEAKRVGEIFKEIASEKKQIVDLENWNLSKQGEKVNLLTNGVPLLNENGELIGYRGVDKDITKRKIAEEKLKEAHEMLQTVNSNLERKVEERTIEIKKLLKQKDEFVNQLGHDLKNPLGPLLNLVPLLEKGETDPERKEIFEILNRNARHMKNLVTKTIELAKLNEPGTKLSFEDTNLLKEIEGVITKGKLLYGENKIEIGNKIGEDIMVNANKIMITELFDNLIGNSVKYSPDGCTITIDVKQDKDFVTVSIKDTGMGMTEEQLSHIFDEFYKADLSRHDFDSSGLGMSICERIVEKHGGKIWAESKGEGKGTTVFFTLPIYLPKKNNR